MTNYYIREIKLTGNKVETARVEFERGLNIIYGPSNTGKSYITECINYMFGSKTKSFRIGTDTGYDCVEMFISTLKGEISLTRKFGDSNIYVESNNPDILSGKYSTISGNLHIRNLWFNLMDIDVPSGILKNESFERNAFTIRTFLHTFFIEEDSIIQNQSILFNKSGYSPTAILSTILYLITGNAFEEYVEIEKVPILEARKNAVIKYINDNLSNLATLKNELKPYENMSLDAIQANIDSTINEIDGAEEILSIAVNRSRVLAEEIYEVNNQLAECSMLHSRYEVLEGQYLSDINRLTFLVEGELHRGNTLEKYNCPFCDGELKKEYEESCAEAAAIEVEKIISQLNDLKEAEDSIISEKHNLQEKSIALKTNRGKIEQTINSLLKPKLDKLRELLSKYRKAIEVIAISNLEDNMITDLAALEIEDKSDLKYKPKEHFNSEIIDGITKVLNNILEACNYDNLSSAYFSLDSFDVVINGRDKSKYGKGYRAFLNTVVALTFMEYLTKYGKYAPGILVIDSPILSLKEKEDDVASDSMKESLFRYMINNQDNGQIIIIENEIPDVDYSNTNLIRFTKDTSSGRYGLLHGLTE